MSRTTRLNLTTYKYIPEGKWGEMTRGPGWYFLMTSTKPKRRRERYLETMIICHGADSDDISWPFGTHKPHLYWW